MLHQLLYLPKVWWENKIQQLVKQNCIFVVLIIKAMSYQSKEISKVDSNHLVDYILSRGGAMSHLKIQKILFYIQAYHLAYFDEGIVDDDFEAWVHGPVSRKVYNSARDLSILHKELYYFLGEGETPPEQVLRETLTSDQIQLVDDVIDELKSLSGLELENMTHSEQPWKYARRGYDPGQRCGVIIPKELIKEYYKSQLYEQKS